MKASAASAASDRNDPATAPGKAKTPGGKPSAAAKVAVAKEPEAPAIEREGIDEKPGDPDETDILAAADAGDEDIEAVVAELAADDNAPIVEDDEEDDAPPATSHAAAPHMGHGGHRSGGMGMMNGRPPQISRASNKDETFAEGDHVVYPTHGVGRVEKIATEEIAGHKLELIHITFEENRMTLRVPVAKARSAGLRQLATRKLFDEALGVLKGRARIKRTMWSRRAQEYEAKINSGDPLAIAEVVRDLHRNSGQPDQSFSERQIYEAAMDRLAAELAALDQTDKTTASTKLTNYLKTIA